MGFGTHLEVSQTERVVPGRRQRLVLRWKGEEVELLALVERAREDER